MSRRFTPWILATLTGQRDHVRERCHGGGRSASLEPLETLPESSLIRKTCLSLRKLDGFGGWDESHMSAPRAMPKGSRVLYLSWKYLTPATKLAPESPGYQ